MKVLITSDWDFEAVNGVVTSMRNLKVELEKRGHEVRLLTLSMNGETIALQKGDSIFIPAQDGEFTLDGQCEVIISYV